MLLSKLSLLWLFCTLYFLQLTLAIPQSAAISKPKEEIWSNVFYLATNECFQISMSPLLLLHYQAIGASDVTPPFTRTSRGSLTSTIFWFFIKMLRRQFELVINPLREAFYSHRSCDYWNSTSNSFSLSKSIK